MHSCNELFYFLLLLQNNLKIKKHRVNRQFYINSRIVREADTNGINSVIFWAKCHSKSLTWFLLERNFCYARQISQQIVDTVHY